MVMSKYPTLPLYPIKSHPNRNNVHPGLWDGSCYTLDQHLLGGSKPEMREATTILSNYVAIKRSRGRDDKEVVKRLEAIQGMVPPELSPAFTHATLLCNLLPQVSPIPPCTPPPLVQPLPSHARPTHRRNASSFSSVETIRTPSSSTTRYTPNGIFSHDSTPSTPPTSLSSYPLAGSSFSGVLASDSDSSFSARPPTEYQPLAFGGWGRAWEHKLKGLDDRGAEIDRVEVDRDTLASFPPPPSHVPFAQEYRSSIPSISLTTDDDDEISDVFAFDSNQYPFRPRPAQLFDQAIRERYGYHRYEDDQETITATSLQSSSISPSSSWTGNWSEPSFGDVVDEMEILRSQRSGPTAADLIKEGYLRGKVPKGRGSGVLAASRADTDNIGIAA